MSMNDDILRVLYSEEELEAKCAELGAQISKDYEGKNLLLERAEGRSRVYDRPDAPHHRALLH